MLRITRSDTAKGIRKDPHFVISFNASVVNTSCSHFKRSLIIEWKAKVFTRLVLLQTPVVMHHSEQESMTVRRVAADGVRKGVKNIIKSIK